MVYEKKYKKKKGELIFDLENAFDKCQGQLNQLGFFVNSINFQNGRNDDDFIIIHLIGKEQSSIKIIFWVNFWLEFEFDNDDFVINYEFYKKEKKILAKNINYSQLNGKQLNEKVKSLLAYIFPVVNEDRKSRKLKWHEEIFMGAISATIGLTVLLNGFSYLTSLFIENVLEHGKPTKQQALLALFSKVESGWWKYLIVIIFLFISFSQINAGIKKFKLKKK